MNSELKILLVEDNPSDYELIKKEIERSGKKCTVKWVQSKDEYIKELKGNPPDIVISDYSLPQFDGLTAVQILKKSGPRIPFILVTGSINEETALQCIKAGAQDYVLKDHLKRIVPAIEAAIKVVKDQIEKENVQERLKKVEESSKFLFENAWVPLLTVDPNGMILSVAGTAAAYANLQPGDTNGKSLYDLMTPEQADYAVSRIKEAIKTGKGYEVEQRINFMGVERCFSANVKPLTVDGSAAECVLIVARDITEKKKIDEALRESEDGYRKLVEITQDAIAIHCGGKLVYINNAGVKMMRAKRPEDLLGRDVKEFVHPDYISIAEVRIKKMLGAKCPVPCVEEKFIRLDGTPLDVEVSGTFFMYKNKPSIQLVLRDITDRKKAEDELKASEAKYRDMFNSARDIVFTLDRAGLISVLNPAFELFCGWETGFWIGKSIEGIFHPDDQPGMREHFAECMRGEIPPVFESKIITKGKGCRIFEIKLMPLFKNAEVYGVQGIATDVTDRKRSEVLVRKSRDFYQKLFDQLPNPMWSADKEGESTFFNKSWLEFRGKRTEEEIRGGWWKDVHPEDRESARQSYRDAFEKREQFCAQYRIKRFDGEYRCMLDYGRPYEDLNGNFGGYIGICHDITDLKDTEDALRTNYKVQTIINSILQISLQDIGLVETLERIIDELLTMPCIGLKGSGAVYLLNDKSGTFSLKANKNLPAGETGSGITGLKDFLNSDDLRLGKTEYFDKLFERGGKQDKYCCVPIRSREKLLGVIILGLKENEKCDGGSFDFLGMVARVITGIIERKRAESDKKELQDQFIQTSKLAALGEMAAGMAHEINNPLTIIMGNAQYIMQNKVMKAELNKLVAEIDEASQRCKKIITSLLGFSRQRVIRVHSCLLNDLVEDVIHVCGSEIEAKKIRIERKFAKDLPEVKASPPHIEQVLINIVINAVQAMKSEGVLTITTWLENNGGEVAASFADTGVGIAPEEIKKIFQPFYTTKPKGTGLGLSVSYGLVKQHGGDITAKSAGPGKGSVFTVILPLNGIRVQADQENIG